MKDLTSSWAVVAALLLLQASGARGAEKTISFASGKAKYSLKVKGEILQSGSKEDSVPALYRIEMSKDGKPVGAPVVQVGCAYQGHLDEHLVSIVTASDHPIGFAVEVGDRCTARNTVRRTILMVPKSGWIAWTNIIHHDPELIYRQTDHGLEVWWTYQERGAGKGPQSAYVEIPRMLVVDEKDPGWGYRFPPLSTDYASWPVFSENVKPGFAQVFLAGMVDTNPSLMKAALEKLYSAKESDLLESLGLPTGKGALEEAANHLGASGFLVDIAFPRSNRIGH